MLWRVLFITVACLLIIFLIPSTRVASSKWRALSSMVGSLPPIMVSIEKIIKILTSLVTTRRDLLFLSKQAILPSSYSVLSNTERDDATYGLIMAPWGDEGVMQRLQGQEPVLNRRQHLWVVGSLYMKWHKIQ